MKYLAIIAGGIGPDVWDKEITLSAVDMIDAAKQATGHAKEMQGTVIEISQYE